MTMQQTGQHSGEQNDGFNLDDRDHLPWLEPAGADDEVEGVSPLRIIGLVVLGLALLGIIVGGGYWLKNRSANGGGEDARLIAAQSASYKIPANASDAKEFDGEGDSAFEASEGGDAAGKIDASKVPEAPRTDLKAAAKPAEVKPAVPTAKPTLTAAVKTVAADPKKATTSTAAAEASVGPRIQIGAFGSKALAEDVWKKLSSRFDYLAALSHSVEPVETGGKTLFRLRASVPNVADAGTTCGKLRVAGENCIVVR